MPQWANQGALGLVILAMVTGWLWAKPAVDKIVKDKECCQREVLERLDEILRRLGDRDG